VAGTSQPLQTLTSLRIGVQQTRSTEDLGLVQRDYTTDNQTDFTDRIAGIDARLEELRGVTDSKDSRERIDAARESLRTWDSAHANMVSLVRQGNYTDAVQAAVGSGDDSVSESFSALDQDLEVLIDDSRDQLRDYLSDAGRAASRVNLLVFVLSLLSILCVVQGTRPRLQEYL
jgi:CHASE3 domain sensor protein